MEPAVVGVAAVLGFADVEHGAGPFFVDVIHTGRFFASPPYSSRLQCCGEESISRRSRAYAERFSNSSSIISMMQIKELDHVETHAGSH
jgi:hypothetical protein